MTKAGCLPPIPLSGLQPRLKLAQETREVRLRTLRLTNFRAARDLAVTLGGSDATISGANASGKTTLADAWTWLLTGKDSAGRGDATVKPLDAAGAERHHLETAVEAEVEAGGARVTLRRSMEERWTKKRGAAQAEFGGHATSYWLDGVPLQEKEWRERLAALLVPEPRIALLTHPAAFAERLHWQERRKLLLDICGDVDVADVVAAEPSLGVLEALRGEKTLDQYRAVTEAEVKAANQALLMLPARVDEAKRACAHDAPGVAEASVKADVATRSLAAAREALARAMAAGRAGQARARLVEMRAQLGALATQRRSADSAALAALASERRRIEADAAIAGLHWDAVKADGERLAREANRLEAAVERARAEWHEVRQRPVEVAAVADACAACGQPLPADQMEAARQRAEEQARIARAEALAAINERGLTLAAQLAECERTEATVVAMRDGLMAERDALNAAGQSAAQPREATPPSAEETALAAEIERLEAVPVADVGGEAAVQLAECEAAAAAAQQMLAQAQGASRARARVAELERELRAAAAAAETALGHLALCDLWVTTRVRLLEERVNARFPSARFKLFDQQINGGIRECCEVAVGGVPWSDLNHAAQVNVGLECIRVLGGHFGVRLPVWVDGRESVTALSPCGAQCISLVVSEADKQPRVSTA